MTKQLTEFFKSAKRPYIAVVGDVMLDEYVWGEVGRVSPEAPIPVMNVSHREVRAGGAGSVLVNLAHLNADVSCYAVCGDDDGGDRLRRLLVEKGVKTDGLVRESNRPTTVKTRHLGFVQSANRAVQQILRVDDEVQSPIGSETIERLVEAFRRDAKNFDAVLVSDYDKGLIQSGLLESLREAAPANAPFLVDPARRSDYSMYRGAFLMCPNRFEAQMASGLPCRSVEECANAATKLAGELEMQAIALTMDADGIYLFERGGTNRHFPTRTRRVADVTGAGDMVLSVLGVVLGAGGTLTQAVDLANHAAGIEVRRMGVTPLSRREIVESVLYEDRPGAAKIKSVEELIPLVKSAREVGEKVVLTNGCFDLFHLGHYHLLNCAAREGDVLIVAINSDESVRSLNKGPNRPIFPQSERLRLIAGLEAVRYVVCFDDDTPLRLLDLLRPDVLVKGGEYAAEGAVGGEFVESYGGRIAYVPHLAGFSTTSLLERGAGMTDDQTEDDEVGGDNQTEDDDVGGDN